jgi:hypothetical protein
MAATKIAALIVAAVVGIWAIVDLIAFSIEWQLASFVFLLVASLASTGWQSTVYALEIVLRFALILVAATFVMSFFVDWDRAAYFRPLYFANSFFLVRVLASYVSFVDLARLPLPAHLRTDVLLAKSLFDQGESGMGRLGWYTSRYSKLEKPGRRIVGLHWLSVVLASILWLLDGGQVRHALILNRQRQFGE